MKVDGESDPAMGLGEARKPWIGSGINRESTLSGPAKEAEICKREDHVQLLI